MLYSVIVVVLLSYVSAETQKIVGGQDTTITNHPYQAMLGTAKMLSYPRLFCGAVVYNAQCVITAGHCCKAFPPSKIRVVAGTSYSNKNGVIRKASKVIIHPDYKVKAGVPDNDVCVIKLNQPFPLSEKIQPIGAIATEADYSPGNNETITGWGTTTEGGAVSQILQEATIQIDSEENCKNAYGDAITVNMVCALANGTDTCNGDSGGPMVDAEKSPFTLTGITSWGNGCAQPGFPGVYTKISNYASWIEENS